MEIVANKGGGVVIGGSNASVVVDPGDASVKGDVVIFMDVNNPLIDKDFGNAIVIVGAGEYEVGEFEIHGEVNDHGVFYTIESNGEKILLLNASDVKTVSSDTRYGTVVVRLDDAFDEGTSSTLPGELVVLYSGNEKIEAPKVEKMEKIGKRKKNELAGKTILLSK